MAEGDGEKAPAAAAAGGHNQEALKEQKLRETEPSRPNSQYYTKTTRGGRSVCACIFFTFLFLIGIVVLILWLVYRPSDPNFKVVEAAIYDLNTSALPLLFTTMEFTIIARNPNRRVSIYYDRLRAFVSYRHQQITGQVVLPPLFLEKRSMVAMSPVLGGGGGSPVAVSLDVANGLISDEEIGVLALRVVLVGRLRWKAGPIKTKHYGIYVKCDVLVGVKRGFVGPLPLLGSPSCRVDI